LKNRINAILQATVVLILMSFGTVLTKIVLVKVKPFTFAWTSVVVGMVVMLIYTFLIRKDRIPAKLDKKIWIFIIIIGLGNFVINRLIRPFGIEMLPATTSAYVMNFVGFLTMAMSCFILKEIPSIFQVAGAAVAIYGFSVYFNQPLAGGELTGIIILIIGITAVALTNNIARKLAIVTKNEISNNLISTIALLIGGVCALIGGLIFDFPPKIPDLQSWGIILYEGVINIAFGLTVWNFILRTLRSYEASILGASSIIWTTIFAIIILDESLKVNQWIGMGLMVVGLLLVQIRRKRLAKSNNHNPESVPSTMPDDL
jgi:drug/metabolite transporter (DMT)-like permease